MDRDATEAALRAFFAARGDAYACAYLFGSVARSSAGSGSDVDVAVLPRQRAPTGSFAALPLDLEGDLERALARRVDVIDLDTAPPDLVHRVLMDGILVHESDPSRRIAFEVRARNEYFDVRPVLDRYRRPRHAR